MTRPDPHEILELRRQGVTWREIWRRTGVSPSTADRWIRALEAGETPRVGRRGPPPGSRQRPPRACDVAGCERPHQARGLCAMHYQRNRRESLGK